MIASWCRTAARAVVPAEWRDSVVGDVDDEAEARSRGQWWPALQIARIGLRLRLSIARDVLMSDGRYACRGLFRSPWFAIGSILTFALGVGINVTALASVDRILFRSLPYDASNRIVLLRACGQGSSDCAGSFPSAIAARLQATSDTIADLAVAGFSAPYTTTQTGDAPPLSLQSVSPHALRVLGVHLRLGRDISDDDIRSRQAVAWLSEETWNANFAGDPAVIGRRLWTQNRAAVVIGVLPKGFVPPAWSSPDLEWAGLVADPAADGWETFAPKGRVLAPFGRLKPGRTVADAEAEVQSMVDGTGEPASDRQSGERVRVDRLDSVLFSRAAPYAWLVILTCWLVLAVTVLNLTVLFAARARTRERLIVISRALGATPSRLLLVAFAEAFVVCATGTAIAVLLLFVSRPGLTALLPPLFGRYAVGPMDMRILFFAVAVACGTAAVTGGVTGIKGLRADMLPLVGRRSTAPKRASQQGAPGLIAAEAAVGAFLALAAIFASQSFVRLTHEDLGIQPKSLYVITLSSAGPMPLPEQSRNVDRALEAVRRVPGVTVAATADFLPLLPDAPQRGFKADDKSGAVVQITSDYFRTLETPLLDGRNFSVEELAGGDSVAIVNRHAAQLLWPNVAPADVIGRSWHWATGPQRTIVGIAADQKGAGALTGTPVVFVPKDSFPSRWGRIAVRVSPDTKLQRSELQAVIDAANLDSRVTLTYVPDRIAPLLRDPRFRAVLLNVLACGALLLVAVGLFALVSADATARTRELGIRMSLGAPASAVRWLLARRVCGPVACGTAIGLTAGWWISAFGQSFLFSTNTHDLATYFAVAIAVAAAAAAALWLPLRRAGSPSAMESLKLL